MAAGAGRALSEGAGNAAGASSGLLDRRDPELASLVRRHGDGYAESPGLMKKELALWVRLLGKLMAKYRGRERHLIHKLRARYEGRDKGAAAAAPSPVEMGG